MEKFCNKCSTKKDISEFGIDNHEKDGHRYQCKECLNARARKYASRNKDIIRARNKVRSESRKAYYQSPAGIESSRRSHLKRKYNITLEEYNSLSEKQNHVCGICNETESNSRISVLCVDHDHSTGKIRGLLCSNCNRSLGLLKDDTEIINNAIKYLKLWE